MAARKNMKDVAAASTSVFEQLAAGNTQNTPSVINIGETTEHTKPGRPAKYDGEMVRLNLKVPADIKEYLAVAAAKKSIEERRQISVTEYLVDLVKKDTMQQ